MESVNRKKTAIARAYALRFRKEYDGVLFLSCSGDFQMVFGDDVRLPISNFRYSQDKYGGKGQVCPGKAEDSGTDRRKTASASDLGRLQHGTGTD